MRFSKKSSTSAALALCIIFSMFYYNIFHLMSNVKLKKTIYVQTSHHIEVDKQREIKSYKEDNVIKKNDNYTDSNNESRFYKDYESYENDSYVIPMQYNLIDSNVNIINENGEDKGNNIKSDNATNNINKIVTNNIKQIDVKVNKTEVQKNITDMPKKLSNENLRNNIKKEQGTSENYIIIRKNTKEKVNNSTKENDINIEKLSNNPINNTIHRRNNVITENNKKIDVTYKNHTQEKIREKIVENDIKENDKHVENIKTNNKDKPNKKDREGITVNENTVINTNETNKTIEADTNDDERKNKKNINKNHNIEEKYTNDINKTINNVYKNNNDTKEINLKTNKTEVEIENKQLNNIKNTTKTEMLANFGIAGLVNVTTLLTNTKQIPDDDFLINTPGCLIPDYSKTMIFNEAPNKGHTCGIRAVFVHKVVSGEIIITIDEKKMNYYKKGNQTYKCCYKYVSRQISTYPGIQDTKVTYSPCVLFTNNTKVELKQEVIAVTCGNDPVKMSKVIYEDVFIIVKKVKKDKIKVKGKKSWNVLILGMDTMSRARAYNTMPRTMEYFQQNAWLDYRGYQKVGYNTFPNLMALLTGKTNVYSACKPSMDHCNDLFIWKQFRNASYATAYGEDFLTLPDTFKNYGGFEIPPTDHYMRPFYLTGEHVAGNLVCTQKQPSAVHMLEYASYFADTYKDKNFFGMFWINSYSHNLFNTPALFDHHMRNFLEKLPMSGVLNNTFIMFLSDHGIRYGEMRYSMESYYEERLPMFYMWVPHEFKKDYTDKYNTLKLNQRRLITPYDLHVTLWEILKMSRDSVTVMNPESCPNCTSIFEEKSLHRTCAEAGVDKKWCSCHKLEPVDVKDAEHKHCLTLAVSSILNITKEIKTIECTRCSALRLKKTLRVHSYHNIANNKTYFIVAFLLSPGDVGYEVTIEKDNTGYYIVTPTTTITAYNTRGDCTVNKLSDRPYCVCEKIPKCHKKPKR